MAYREVRRMDMDQVIRRWLAGEKIRAIARSTGADRNTVRRIVRFAEKEGIGRVRALLSLRIQGAVCKN
jgi:DNA-binding Lrp family transcriptional regulator